VEVSVRSKGMASARTMQAMVLLTPGPCHTSDAVRSAAAAEDMNHRMPAFADLTAEIGLRLRRLAGGAHAPYVLGGSGTAAMEAMAASCVEAGPVLIVANGCYSERWAAIFAIHGIPHTLLSFPWTDPWRLDVIAQRLRRERYEAVLATHHETTSGRLNPVGALAQMAREHGARVMIDASSSLGAEALDFEGLHAVCGLANKCLHGLPGVSFVLCGVPPPDEPRRTYYLHLPMYAGDSAPLTPPVPALLAFRQALRELDDQGGPAARGERYARQAARVREALRGLGMTTPVPDTEASCALTMATVPDGWSAQEWLDANLERGFMLYGCKGVLEDRCFQVSTMGEVTDAMVDAWLDVAHDLARRGPRKPG
jgi:2-aminoethylphosphonate-pyruvate transaminase